VGSHVGHGMKLLQLFAQYDRIRVENPLEDLQIKFTRQVASGREFVAYVDAIGYLDGAPCVIDWKTTSARYPEEPQGLLSLDPQLVCYSWITGQPTVSFVVFVRKQLPEIQFLKAEIRISKGPSSSNWLNKRFLDRIRRFSLPFRNPLPAKRMHELFVSGPLLGNDDLTGENLIRRPGEDLGWIDQIPD
jgi:hypothetical protein